ncbi:MAG: HU family DNA-binding protein [Rubrobacter sp.]
MNETELIEELAQRTGSSKDEAQRRVEALGSAVAAALKGGDEVGIPGFGKFYVQEREAREGTNSQTKRRVRVPASKVPKFEAGNGLKRAV